MRKILLLPLALSATLTAAQDADLENVLVTASRTPVSAAQAGSSYTVIDRQELERRQIVYVADALRDVPGFAMSRAGTLGSQTQFRIRGAEANHVMVFIDGVEANDPASGDEFLFEQLMTTEIERIEIIRGPQSALWGSDALAGVINLITRRGPEPFSASGYFEAGRFSTSIAGGQVSAIGDVFDLNLGISHLDTDGDNVSRIGDEDDGSRNSTFSFNAGARVSERTRLEIFARRTESLTEFDGTDFVSTGLPTDADRETDAMQQYLRISAKTSSVNERWQHQLSLTQLETDNRNTDAGSFLGSTAAEKFGVYWQTSLALDESQAHRLTFAVDHETQDFAQRGPASPFGDPNQDQSVDTTGYVLEYQGVDLGPFSVSAALRHDDNSAFDDISTYRLTGSYRVETTATRLYSSFGTGQKSPTFVDRFGFFSDEFIGNPQLKPETSKGWEIGFEQPLPVLSASFAATYFDEQLEDEIDGFVFDPASSFFTAANRPGRSERSGVELRFEADLSSSVELSGNYTYLDSTERQALGVEVDETRRPKNMFSMRLNYAPGTRTNINFSVSYNGSQDDVAFPPWPQPPERVRLDSYTLVGIAASYQLTPAVQLIGRIENLLDEDYEDVVGFNTPGVGAYFGVRVAP